VEANAMPRKSVGIEPVVIKKLTPGRYGDGGGLYLLVRPPSAKHAAAGEKDGGRFWLYRYRLTGRMREMGLGAADGNRAVSLKDARAKAAELNALVKSGVDPLAKREADAAAEKAAAQAAQARAKTFRDVAALYVAAHEAGWRNAKHRAQWTSTLETYAYPFMGDLAVGDVVTAHVMAALEPIWRTKPETATRLRGRIEAVIDYAKARGWRSGENPARWRGHVANMLPARSKVQRVEHHAALPWRDMGAFMATLWGEGGLASRALELTILTAARSGEVLGARWGEIEFSEALWTVPGDRMKAGREHRVPLSEAALAVLRKLLPMRDPNAGNWVFPGARAGRPLSNMSMEMLLRRMERGDLTVHGFRSSFRDWCAESTGYQREVAEAALAHTLGDKVEAAYRRGDLFEKRRQLMEAWATFCTQPSLDCKVIYINEKAL
jgi:integrase